MYKKLLPLFAVLIMAVAVFAGCGTAVTPGGGDNPGGSTNIVAGKTYYALAGDGANIGRMTFTTETTGVLQAFWLQSYGETPDEDVWGWTTHFEFSYTQEGNTISGIINPQDPESSLYGPFSVTLNGSKFDFTLSGETLQFCIGSGLTGTYIASGTSNPSVKIVFTADNTFSFYQLNSGIWVQPSGAAGSYYVDSNNNFFVGRLGYDWAFEGKVSGSNITVTVTDLSDGSIIESNIVFARQ